MFRISKSTLSWGGVAIAAILFTLAVPRAAHAVAAALVQVTNTASSPVISQGIGNQAAQIVEIECGDQPFSDVPTNGCWAVPASGFGAGQGPVPGSTYYVPSGETLVVTSVDIFSGIGAGSPCMSSAFANLITTQPINPSFHLVRKSWIVPSAAGTAHYTYPSGILFSPETTLTSLSNGTTTCTLAIDMHGYLTAQ
jgi:hypothetical protein